MKSIRALLDSWRRDLAYASRTGGIGDRRVTMAGGRLSVELRSLAACAELVADALQDDAFAAAEAARPVVIAADVEPVTFGEERDTWAQLAAAFDEMARGCRGSRYPNVGEARATLAEIDRVLRTMGDELVGGVRSDGAGGEW